MWEDDEEDCKEETKKQWRNSEKNIHHSLSCMSTVSYQDLLTVKIFLIWSIDFQDKQVPTSDGAGGNEGGHLYQVADCQQLINKLPRSMPGHGWLCGTWDGARSETQNVVYEGQTTVPVHGF